MPESQADQLPLGDDLLDVMRRAARITLDDGEPAIAPRALLLALLDDPSVGAAIATVVNREKLEEIKPAGDAAAVRYDTLAFKTPDGRASLWLNRESFAIFLEGAQRAEERYLPKHLALGIAAEAILAPGVLAALRVEPGVFSDAIFRL